MQCKQRAQVICIGNANSMPNGSAGNVHDRIMWVMHASIVGYVVQVVLTAVMQVVCTSICVQCNNVHRLGAVSYVISNADCIQLVLQ